MQLILKLECGILKLYIHVYQKGVISYLKTLQLIQRKNKRQHRKSMKTMIRKAVKRKRTRLFLALFI